MDLKKVQIQKVNKIYIIDIWKRGCWNVNEQQLNFKILEHPGDNVDSTDDTDDTDEEPSGKYLITYIENNENYSNMLIYV